MSSLRFPVAVLMRRVVLDNRWASEQWQPIDVLPAAARADEDEHAGAPRCVDESPEGSTWRFDGLAIELHRTEAEGYFLNLSAPHPVVFVMWRPAEDGAGAPRPVVVTVSYNEGARMLDGGEQVDPVPMRDAIRDWVTPFMQAHYTPEPRRKVKRNDPFADRDPRRRNTDR